MEYSVVLRDGSVLQIFRPRGENAAEILEYLKTIGGETHFLLMDENGLGISDGDRVEVSSRRGRVCARAKLTEKSPKGVIFMTFHFAETPTNVLTNPALDPVAKIPELKVCAVRLGKFKAEERGVS